jgi:hypothetical protein
MEECEHRLAWIRKRPDGDFYCTVCRKVLYEQDKLFEEVEEEFEKQRRIDRLLRE